MMPNNAYIKRADALQHFENYTPGGSIVKEDVINGLKEIPAADVAPVIRCRDCKHAMMTYSGECKYCKMWMQDGVDEALYLDGDFYCAFAERKGENAAVH